MVLLPHYDARKVIAPMVITPKVVHPLRFYGFIAVGYFVSMTSPGSTSFSPRLRAFGGVFAANRMLAEA
jgi:hypothetical protein